MTFVFPEIRSLVIVSTAHVSKKDGALLLSSSVFPIQGVICDGAATLVAVDGVKDDYYQQGFSRAFVKLMCQLGSTGAHYVIFDADGPVVKGLKTYKW